MHMSRSWHCVQALFLALCVALSGCARGGSPSAASSRSEYVHPLWSSGLYQPYDTMRFTRLVNDNAFCHPRHGPYFVTVVRGPNEELLGTAFVNNSAVRLLLDPPSDEKAPRIKLDVRIVPSGAATGLSTQSASNPRKGTGSGEDAEGAGTVLPLEAPMILRSELGTTCL
ncbi:hypothetical protein C8Q76DRAFT_115299 [Earliella scabrosa]|nr:hypothetical protein C8Q76DRAFT_115299 [Earliella scabrosa]